MDAMILKAVVRHLREVAVSPRWLDTAPLAFTVADPLDFQPHAARTLKKYGLEYDRHTCLITWRDTNGNDRFFRPGYDSFEVLAQRALQFTLD